MKFEKAMEAVFDKTAAKHGEKFALDSNITAAELNVAAKVWNAVAIALSEKGLDDFVIVRNNSIISIPFTEEKPVKNEKPCTSDDSKKGKGKSPDQKTATNEKVDVKEKDKPDTETAESAQ